MGENRMFLRAGAAVLLVATAVGGSTPVGAAAPACTTSAPAGAAYEATVCMVTPDQQAQVSGNVTVTASVQFTGAGPGVRSVEFALDGEYVLTDFQAPYSFTLPTARWADATRELTVTAELRDAFMTTPAGVTVTFANAVTDPPVNGDTFTPAAGSTPAPGRPFRIAAVGDGAGGETGATDVTDRISTWNPNLLLYLGDVYDKGTETEFHNHYAPADSYGRFKAITNPTIGNHEARADGSVPGYVDYWDNVPHYYSYDAGGWHFISLDSTSEYGQTGRGSPQYRWLRADLAANTRPCTIAYYHHPLFNIGPEGSATRTEEIWKLLVDGGVDLVLAAHDHTYQRWAALDGAGALDTDGLTQMISGTGGHSRQRFVNSDSRVVQASTGFGALRLDLNQAGVAFAYINAEGVSLDSGSVACRGLGADTVAPTAPGQPDFDAVSRSQVDLSWSPAADDVGIVGYDVYRNGTLLERSGPEPRYSDSEVSPDVKYSYTVRARDAAGNLSGDSPPSKTQTPTPDALFADSFESGNLLRWTTVSGLQVQSANVFSGMWAVQMTNAGGAATYASKTLSPARPGLYYRVRFRILSQAAKTTNLLRFKTSTGAKVLTVFSSSKSRLTYRNDVGLVTRSSTTAITPGWHTLQVRTATDLGRVETWLDGTPITTLTRDEALGSAPIGRIELGDSTRGGTYDVAYDEVAADPAFIADTQAPTTPETLTAESDTGLVVSLRWTAASDDTGVSGYEVFRDGTRIATVAPSGTYADTTVDPNNSYYYTLRAVDAAGNRSGSSPVALVETPAAFRDGFERGDLSAWSVTSGMAVTDAPVYTGSWAARATSSGVPAYAYHRLASARPELFVRVHFDAVSVGSNPVTLLRLRTTSGGALATVSISSTGKLALRDDVSSVQKTSPVLIARGRWYELQLRLLVGGASSRGQVWLDGVPLPALEVPMSLGAATAVGRVEVGDTASNRTFDVAFDDLLVDTAMIPDTRPPTAAELTATAVSAQRVDLSWTPSVDNQRIESYDVYRDGSIVARTVGNVTSLVDDGLTAGTSYSYEVRANDAGENGSPASNTALVETPAGCVRDAHPLRFDDNVVADRPSA